MKMSHLYLLHLCMNFCGLRPPNNSDRFYSLKTKLSLTVCFYHAIGVGAYLIRIIPNSNVPMAEKLEALFIISGYYNMLFNTTAIFSQRYTIKRLFVILENFKNTNEPNGIKKIAFMVNVLAFCLLGYVLFGSLIISLIPVYQYENCLWEGEKANFTVICGFATKVIYPYDVSKGFLYLIHVLIETYCICFACYGGSTIVPSTLATFEYIILRIDQLKLMLKEVFVSDDRKEQENRFRSCIIFHLYIIELANMSNRCFTKITYPALVHYSICIGSTLVAFLAGHTATSFFNLCGWGVGIYIMCLTGQRIHDESLSIADAVYEIEWYKASPRLRKDICLMMCRAQKPLMYECGFLGDFHFVTFNNIMSTAYKFTTLKTGVSG